MKLFFDHEILSFWISKKLIIKLKNQNFNQIACSKKERLDHETGHINWMENAAC